MENSKFTLFLNSGYFGPMKSSHSAILRHELFVECRLSKYSEDSEAVVERDGESWVLDKCENWFIGLLALVEGVASEWATL
jgi:hypothetical protein